jgi:predicted nucleic acid-binding protein
VTLYLDTSSLMKLYVEEWDGDRIQQLVSAADVVVTSALAYPEARATLARRRRERLMTPTEAASARAQLDADWPHFVVIACGDDLAQAAGRLAETLGLRGGDAVHLASFEDLLGRCPDDDVRFSSADARLNRAARQLG